MSVKGSTLKRTVYIGTHICLLVGILLCVGSILPSAMAAQSVSWDRQNQTWLSQQSEHFTIHFRDGHQSQAAKSLDIAERVHSEMLPFFIHAPENRTEIVLVDDFDFSNGWATPFPFAQIRLFMSPPEDVNGLEANDEWLHMLIRHEYAHIMHMELGAGAVKGVRKVLGRNGLLFPHALTPSMLIEGVAVYLETNKTLGYGRLQGSVYDMQMRMEVASGKFNDLEQVVVASREWPLGSQYLYGAYFIEYLVATYGEEKLALFLQDYSRKLLPYFLLNGSAETVFGKDFFQLWDDFQQDFEIRYDTQIRELAQQAVTGRDIAINPYLQVTAPGNHGLLVARKNGEDRAVISRLNNSDQSEGKWQNIANTKGITALDLHPTGGLVVSRIVNYTDGRQINDLFLYQDNGWIRLTERLRFRKVRWMLNGRQLLASRNIDGLSELWLIDAGNSHTSLVWRGEQGDVLGSFDISPTGDFVVASMKRPHQGWNLERLPITSLPTGNLLDIDWLPLTDTKATENSPVYLPDGRIAYSADYEGVYNIFVISPNSGEVTQWTREIGGAFQPQWQPYLGLAYQSYDTDGYHLKVIEQPKPLTTFTVSSQQGRYDYPPVVVNTSDKSAVEPYTPWSSLRPRTWLPLLFIDDNSTEVGFLTSGSDALSRHNYWVSSTWDFDNDVANFNAGYRYDNRWLFAYERSHNFETFIQNTSSGNEITDRRITQDDNILLQRNNIFTAWEDDLALHAGITWEKESLVSEPSLSNLPPYRPADESLFGFAFTFDNRETYLNVPGIGWGHYADFIVETNALFNGDYSGEKYQGQWRGTWDFPGRTSLTGRLGFGYADDSAKSFRLGGTDLFEESRLFGRDTQALRGYDESVQLGHRYATQRLEIETWLGRLERNWGLYPVGIGDISGSVFIDSGAAWKESNNIQQLTGAGVQITIEAKLGYGLTLPVTLGYAHGFDEELGKEQFYLNVTGNFW
ncbi:MAG: hypothetical protein V7735_18720 [Photobacterium frigidiphilum]|uniref:hypothetical protein n=1 Tax=Photobacterium frigidiphilum TaxID=264736 RepID=UPI003001D026